MSAFNIVRVVLSDGSKVYNVVASGFEDAAADAHVTFACESARHARELRDALNRCAWVEVSDFAPSVSL